MERFIAIIASAAIGMLMLGAVAIYGPRALFSSNVQIAAGNATDIWTSAQAVYSTTAGGGASNYTSVTTAGAIRAGIVPSGMSPDQQTIRGPWAGSTVNLSGNATQFFEDWNQIPSAVCARFALSQAAWQVTVNGTTMYYNNTASIAPAVAAACNQGNNSWSEVKFGYMETAGQ